MRNGHKQARPVADDLGEAALALVPVESSGRKAGQFDALIAADKRALHRKRVMACEGLRTPAREYQRTDLARLWTGDSGEPEGLGDHR